MGRGMTVLRTILIVGLAIAEHVLFAQVPVVETSEQPFRLHVNADLISHFAGEDGPVTAALVIDASGITGL